MTDSATVPSSALPSYGITGSDNNLIISPDSAVEFGVDADSDVNTHPIELGGFSGYNRVQNQVGIRLLLACQGILMSRSTFVSTLKSLREGTQVVTVSTPDASWPNMTLKGFGYKKTAERGAVTIWADTQWIEERSTNVTVSPPATSQPQGAATTSLGALSPAAPTGQQQAAIASPTITPVPLPADYSLTAPPSGFAF
jgi:hypothetical protein